MNIYSIYRITNLITNKVYIGFTSNPTARWGSHCSESKNKNSKNAQKILYQSMRKHNIENFIFDVIYQSKDAEHTKNVMENYFITEYNSYIDFPNSGGYNMTLGGDGLVGYTPSKETCEQISISLIGNTNGSGNKGKSKSKRHRANIGLALVGRAAWNKGKILGPRNKPSPLKGKPSKLKGKPRSKIQCPYCSKEGGISGMKRYHFDNCKSRRV
ncbi:MAG TPA: GIY-YIG nuclease family protein [Methanosarcina sp.]|nr:GIY-YIG nuclease family protein [Methanosarcina sp.]